MLGYLELSVFENARRMAGHQSEIHVSYVNMHRYMYFQSKTVHIQRYTQNTVTGLSRFGTIQKTSSSRSFYSISSHCIAGLRLRPSEIEASDYLQ